ncbi:hypothetical protein DRW41_13520 [Neobacillus piezotolerans]|uniref:Photolyase/cryptochrome alpha/beta domain-containing protein n=1 Tax=Neobacillus piezotolerans TaxID=2259171 RepID=A0A3D8GQS9_9BACI|nr:FAD-binding domain-containing protein [Neobacillus piezotolerans]RDU36539.1 hypothetical protein DRW41_13520 [Neobacillus piezotolerans]
MNIVWYRRDLRVNDHLPLSMAAKYGEVLPLYIIEPRLWQGGILSARHLAFVLESLEELSNRLAGLGGRLYVTLGNPEEVFKKLRQEYGATRVFFYKTREMADFPFFDNPEKSDIQFEPTLPYTFESRNIPSKAKWLKMMEGEDEIAPPKLASPGRLPPWLSDTLGKFRSYHDGGELIPAGQPGGERNAEETLQSFLKGRYEKYGRSEDGILKASNYSSRLSPYLSWGNLSLKTVVKKSLGELREARTAEQQKAMTLFLDRLYSRFIACETCCYEMDGLPSSKGIAWNSVEEERIRMGRTGIPIIDAAILSLRKTGWLPSSLRAVLTIFLCIGLRLDKQMVKEFLGSLLLDYDPCILTREVEKCASLSGRNLSGYFHPVRSGKKLDREGVFIKRHIPELNSLSAKYVHEPWSYPGFYTLGYPVPLKDPESIYKAIKLTAADSGNKSNKNVTNPVGNWEQIVMDLSEE